MSPPLHGHEAEHGRAVAPARAALVDRHDPIRSLVSTGVILLCLGLAYGILVRSCGADHGAVLGYLAYVVGGVWLPGHLLLACCTRGRPGLAWSVALGLPLGFALEILLYLAAAASGWREAFPGLIGMMALGLGGWQLRRAGWRNLVPAIPRTERGVLLMLAVLAMLILVTTAARMYAAAPLDAGRLTHNTHHDWVYLVSRAAEIKNQWPLEDPSLAGTPLSYHYFLLVHVAAASQVTGQEVARVLLRLAFLPMGAALLMQIFLLGKSLAGSGRSGVVAAVLLFATGEVSQVEPSGGGLFQGLFISWLYVSPTFYFGMIFMGALLIWLRRHLECEPRPSDYAVLFLLALVGTGAKGTTVGPLAAAAGLWCLWYRLSGRGWPWRMGFAGATLVAGFLVAYLVFLRGYSGNGTAWQPFAFPSVSGFWLEHGALWRQRLEGWGLPAGSGAALAGVAGSAIVLLGMNGVLVIGLAYGLRFLWRGRDGYALWMGLVAVSCIAFGNLLFLDSHGEAYLYLPMKLPLAALTAAALASIWQRGISGVLLSEPRRRVVAGIGGAGAITLLMLYLVAAGQLPWWSGAALALAGWVIFAPPSVAAAAGAKMTSAERRVWLRLLVFVPVCLVFSIQFGFFLSENRSGLALWRLHAAQAREPALADLQRALDWVRRNTPTDALLIANPFTPTLARLDGAAVLDGTSMDKYYYYSALAERRLLVEGPSYLRDQHESARRMEITAALLSGLPWSMPEALQLRQVYLLYDRSVTPDQAVTPPKEKPIYTNDRVSIYRLPGA